MQVYSVTILVLVSLLMKLDSDIYHGMVNNKHAVDCCGIILVIYYI